MRVIIFVFLSLASCSLLAAPCSETPVWNKEVVPQMQRVEELDKQGDESLKTALSNLQNVSKKDGKQMVAYMSEMVSKPHFAKLQQDRQDLGVKALSLMSGTDCNAIIENNKNLQSAVSLQWLSVLAAVQADTQVYMAKNIGNIPDIKATTEAGKKVILHANGTWSESPQK